LSGAQASDFVAGCQQSAAGQVVDCGCLLSELAAAGYDTPNSLNGLMAEGDSTTASQDPGARHSALAVAAVACRR
jgi:hypothetical protein